MAPSVVSPQTLPLLSLTLLFMLLFLSMGRGCDARSEVKKTWCVAKPSSDEKVLKANIDYACNHVDCGSVLGNGKPCFFPDTYINHASVAMNLYYQANGRNPWNCYFNKSALVTATDPSYDNCTYT